MLLNKRFKGLPHIQLRPLSYIDYYQWRFETTLLSDWSEIIA